MRQTGLKLGKSPSGSQLWALVFLALLALLCLGAYARYTQTVVDGWDPLAYLYAGERIAEGHGPTLCHPFNEVIGPYFTLAGFNIQVRRGPCLYLNYPPGFPLLLAATRVLTGLPDAALYVPAILGVLGQVVTFALGTLLFDPWVGLLGALAIGLTPTYFAISTAPWSDLAATVFTTGGIAFYLWGDSCWRTRQQRATLAAVLGGGLVIYGVFIRYASVIALLPLAFFFLASQKRSALRRTHHWLFVGLVVLGLAAILLFNHVYFGEFLTTGYSPRHGWYTWAAFNLRYALGASPAGGRSLTAALGTLLENFRWLLVPSLVGLLLMPVYKRLLIGGLISCFLLFYGVYAFAPQGINARLLLPAFPALALAAAYGLRYGVMRWGWRDRKGRSWSLLGGLLLIAALFLPLPDRLDELDRRNASAKRHVVSVQSFVQNTTSDSVFLAYGFNDAITYYGGRTGLFYRRMPPFDPEEGVFRWDQLEPRLVETVTQLLKRDVSVYYVQDNDPPLADSLDVLRRHFTLNAQGTVPEVYEVQWGPAEP